MNFLKTENWPLKTLPPSLWLLASGLWLLPATPGSAQVDEAEAIPTVSVTLKTLSIGRGNFSGILVQAEEGEDPVPLTFSRYVRGAPVEYEGPADIVFFRQQPNPVPDLPPVRTPVGVVSMDPNNPVEEALVIFYPISAEEAGGARPAPIGQDLVAQYTPQFKIWVMDDSLEAFPRDSLMVFNATGARLFGSVIGREMVIPAGATGPFGIGRNFTAAFAIETQDGPKLVYENVLEFSGEKRVIFMLRPPKRRGSLRIQAYAITENLENLELLQAGQGG